MRAVLVHGSVFHRAARLTLGAVLLVSAGCGSSANTSSTAPSTANRCGVTVATATPAVPATGGTGSVSVNTARECSWTARADTSWITLNGTSGQGPATIGYSVAGNDRGTQRRGSVIVSDQRVEIVQEAAPCRYDVTPPSREVEASGGEVTIDLAATPGCTWTAAGDRDWISAATPAAGEGSAAIRFTVGVNNGPARSATLTIANRTVTVTQAAAAAPQPAPPPPAPPPSPAPTPAPAPPPCTPTVSPTAKDVSAGGEEVVVSVTAPAGCAWTSTSAADWIAVASEASGSGSASVRLVVAPNSGAARTGTVTVAGHQVTITQQAPAPAPCTFSIAPPSNSIERDAADLSVDVRAGSNCSWTAASRVDWITVTAGAAGSGNGTVRLRVSANAGAARTGTVLIAGQTYTVEQKGQSCTYSIKPRSYDAGRGPDDVLVQVEAPAGCAWTAASNASWVVVREGQTGSGSGTVRLLVEANTGAPRTATIAIAGLAFTLTQNGPLCTNAIDPESKTMGPAGGDVAVTVTANTGCTWNATSDVSWIAVIDGASGVGSGSVRLRVEPNTTATARAGTVRIAGQTFTVQQEAVPACSYSIKPTWYDAGRGPDDFTVDVHTDPGCAWKATSPVSWATIAEGASGSGKGTVRIVVEANFGEARSATLTIAGVAFTLRQAAR